MSLESLFLPLVRTDGGSRVCLVCRFRAVVRGAVFAQKVLGRWVVHQSTSVDSLIRHQLFAQLKQGMSEHHETTEKLEEVEHTREAHFESQRKDVVGAREERVDPGRR